MSSSARRRLAPRLAGGVQVEDRRADLPDRGVEMLDRRCTRAAHSGSAIRRTCSAAHAGGEQPLDHVVVQIAGDPVAVGEHVELALGALLLGELQRQRGLLGERRQQRHLARARTAARPARRSATSTPMTGPGAQRHRHRGPNADAGSRTASSPLDSSASTIAPPSTTALSNGCRGPVRYPSRSLVLRPALGPTTNSAVSGSGPSSDHA